MWSARPSVCVRRQFGNIGPMHANAFNLRLGESNRLALFEQELRRGGNAIPGYASA